jgi:hypothetical protein
MDASERDPFRGVGWMGSLVAAAVAIVLLIACSKDAQTPAASENPSGVAGQQTGSTEPASESPVTPAPAVTQASWTPDALEQLVAPIALYPDQLLGQVLAASVNSQEVLDGGNWLLQNQDLKGDQLDAAAQKAGFGPPMRALVQFPTVVDMMCQQIDWTRQLGAAFTSDQSSVLEAVQSLRAQAEKVGNLKSTPQQKVETKTDNGKTVIEVQPAEPTVIYVPQYNPQVVYTTPPPPAPPPSSSGTVNTGAAVVGGLLAFGVGVMIGSAMHDDYCYPHWGAGAVYVGPRPFYPPAYVYRPVYGPAFRPAYGYAPPPGYRYSYNNVNVNRNVNVNVNNNYFNQFNHNQNLRVNNTQNLGGATQRNVGQNQPGWKGQSTYAGAHGNNLSGRTNTGPGERSNTPATRGSGSLGTSAAHPGQRDNTLARTGQPGTRPGAGGAASAPSRAPQNRPSESLGANRPASQGNLGGERTAGVDRGFGGSNRPEGNAGLGTSRPAAAARSGGSAGVGDLPGHQGAFSGAQSGGGGFDRAASARGHASAGGRQFGGHVGRR